MIALLTKVIGEMWARVFALLLIAQLSLTAHSQSAYQFKSADPFLESWRWKHFSELDNEEVFSVTEDENGNFWFGCANHILEYNGYEFKKTTIPKDVSVGFVRFMKTNEMGLFIGSYLGVCKYHNGKWTSIFRNDTEKKKLTKIQHFGTSQIEAISDSLICVVMNIGICVITPGNVHFYSTPNYINLLDTLYPEIKFHQLSKDLPNGRPNRFSNLLKQGGKYYFTYSSDGNKLLKVSFSNSDNPMKVDSIIETELPFNVFRENYTYTDLEDKVWLSNSAVKTPVVELCASQNFTRHLPGNNFDGNNSTYEVTGINGQVIFGATGCFYVYNKQTEQFTQYSKPEVPLLASSEVHLFQDSHNQIWFINSRSKVFRFDYSQESWTTYPNLNFQFEEKDTKQKWFISKDNKLVLNNGSQWKYYNTQHGLMEKPLKIIRTSRGHYWCIGNHKGKAATAYLNNGKWVMQRHKEYNSFSNRGLFEDSRGNIWIGSLTENKFSGKGVLKLFYTNFDNLKWEKFIAPSYTYDNFVEYNDSVYGSMSTGAYIVNKEKKKRGDFAFGTDVLSLEVDKDGMLWCGTMAKGAIKIGGKKQINYSLNSGLISKLVFDIHATEKGIWLATETDISFFDGNDWTNNCFPSEFVLEPEGGQLSSTSDGRLWFSLATKEWVRENINDKNNKADLGRMISASYMGDTLPPQTMLDFKVDTIEQDGNAFITWKGIDKWGKTPTSQLMFSYKIDEEDWSPYSTEKTATFLSLASGKHEFMVRAKDLDFNVDPSPAEFTFYVMPPIWKRPWFILLLSTFTAVIIYLWLNIVKRNKRLAENNNALKEQKEEILAQNEEIHQQAEELEAQKDALAQSHESISQSFKRFEMLSEFGQKITATLDIDSIYNMIFSYATDVIDIDAFGIGLHDNKENLIYFPKFYHNRDVETDVIKHLDDEKSLTAYCYNKQELVFISDFEEEAKDFGLTVTGAQNKALSRIHIPLTVEKKKLGLLVINSDKRNAYDKEDLTNLQTLASYISIALDNAQAYDTIHLINKNTEKSINYASTIQNAFLTQPNFINKYINAFVLFKPKDIVSGDFYWFTALEKDVNKPTDVFIAAMDCTGHGVPGALMSMIGNNLLNLIINVNKVHEPALILEQLNSGVKQALKQETTGNNDGMDAAFVRIREQQDDTYRVNFGGAKNPLIVIHEDGSVDRIKGSRASIGGAKLRKEKVFEQQELSLKSGDQLYLFSDGYADQNGANREKFGRENMLNLLKENANRSLTEQQQLLEEALQKHKKNTEQRDDITVIGVKLNTKFSGKHTTSI